MIVTGIKDLIPEPNKKQQQELAGKFKVNELTLKAAVNSMNSIKVEENSKTKKYTVEKMLKDLKLASTYAASKSPVNKLWYKLKKQVKNLIEYNEELIQKNKDDIEYTQSSQFIVLKYCLITHRLKNRLKASHPNESLNIAERLIEKVSKTNFEKIVNKMVRMNTGSLNVLGFQGYSAGRYPGGAEKNLIPKVVDYLKYVRNNKSFYGVGKNLAVYGMIASGVDFLAQNFRVGIVFSNSKDTKKMKPEKVLYSRYMSITVPQKKAKVFTVKLPMGQVDKIGSRFEGTHEATLTVRLDENLREMSILNSIGYSEEGDFNFHEKNKNASRLIPYTATETQASLFNKKSRIDIVVKHTNTASAVEKEWNIWQTARDAVTNNGGLGDINEPLNEKSSMVWVFEDVNILGPSGGINFDRDGGSGFETSQITFIYKRLVRITPEEISKQLS